MKYLDVSIHNRVFEIIQQDVHLHLANENFSNVSDVIRQHMYDMTYQHSVIGHCAMYQLCITNLNFVYIIGIAFDIANKTIEFTSKDCLENTASKHKLQRLNELLSQQIELARIQDM